MHSRGYKIMVPGDEADSRRIQLMIDLKGMAADEDPAQIEQTMARGQAFFTQKFNELLALDMEVYLTATDDELIDLQREFCDISSYNMTLSSWAKTPPGPARPNCL